MYCTPCYKPAKARKERERIARVGYPEKKRKVQLSFGSVKPLSVAYFKVINGKVMNVPIVDCSCGGKHLEGVTKWCCIKLKQYYGQPKTITKNNGELVVA